MIPTFFYHIEWIQGYPYNNVILTHLHFIGNSPECAQGDVLGIGLSSILCCMEEGKKG